MKIDDLEGHNDASYIGRNLGRCNTTSCQEVYFKICKKVLEPPIHE